MLNYNKIIKSLIYDREFNRYINKLPYIKLSKVNITHTNFKKDKLYIYFQLIGKIGNNSYDNIYEDNRLVYEISHNDFILYGNECKFDKKFLKDILDIYPDGSIAEQPWSEDFDSREEYEEAYKNYKEELKYYYDEGGLTHLLSCLPNNAFSFISMTVRCLVTLDNLLDSIIDIKFDDPYIIFRNTKTHNNNFIRIKIEENDNMMCNIEIHNDVDSHYFTDSREIYDEYDFSDFIISIVDEINTKYPFYKNGGDYKTCIQILNILETLPD